MSEQSEKGAESSREKELEELRERQKRELQEFEERQRRELKEFERQEESEIREFEDKHSVFHIKIDRTQFEVSQHELTGAELRQLPSPPIGPDRDLFEVVPGGSDLKIAENQKVKMRDGLRFFTAPAQINPGSM